MLVAVLDHMARFCRSTGVFKYNKWVLPGTCLPACLFPASSRAKGLHVACLILGDVQEQIITAGRLCDAASLPIP